MARSYLTIRTQLRTYLFEMDGSGSDVSSALGKKKGALGVFDSKSEAIKFAEAYGMPIELLKIGSLSPPASMATWCGESPLSKKKKIFQK